MRTRVKLHVVVPVLILLATAAFLVVGCGGSPGGTATTTAATAGPVPATTTTTKVVVLDFLSTFQAKDPFIQQMISTTSGTGPTTTGGQGGSTTTTRGSTTSTRSTSTTTTTPYPTQTTSGSHYLKLLSVSSVNGVAVCTFEVDRVVYQDKKVGDLVSTSWGQIKVLSISTQNQTVTFQHGSEVRTLSVGQQIVK